MTGDALRALYAQPGMTVARAAAHLAVDEAYLRGRLHGLGLTMRPGSFTPHLPAATVAELTERAPGLYQDGWTLSQIAAELGVSATTVRSALHDARLPVRTGGGSRQG